MVRMLAIFVLGCVAFGMILGGIAWLADAADQWPAIAVVGLICGLPGIVMLGLAEFFAGFRRETAILVVFGGMAVRTPVALGLGWVAAAHFPQFTPRGDLAFWGWLIAYYLFTLTWEVTIVARRELRRPAVNMDRG